MTQCSYAKVQKEHCFWQKRIVILLIMDYNIPSKWY